VTKIVLPITTKPAEIPEGGRLINCYVSGLVRLNGKTIGSATLGATERANNDTKDLFTELWEDAKKDET
jgi:hypothetical protein